MKSPAFRHWYRTQFPVVMPLGHEEDCWQAWLAAVYHLRAAAKRTTEEMNEKYKKEEPLQ